TMEFKAIIENFNTKLWSYHLKVPNLVAKHFLDQGVKRVVCTLNKIVELQCAIMSAGDGVYFILINKKIRDQLKLKEGSKVEVQLTQDDSEFGLPFPVELEEVLAQDKAGKDYFDKLTPGKQRNIIYAAGQVKNPDLRIHRAMILVDHLKKNKGKIDFKQLNVELRTQ
ncbi:MAG TPA: YdeI/OmpD-associated family protein, partial [Saprospiraceae bacterium]|nr:YdeI/OmpD-associated family protein [Saprospiraceae bacterium]